MIIFESEGIQIEEVQFNGSTMFAFSVDGQFKFNSNKLPRLDTESVIEYVNDFDFEDYQKRNDGNPDNEHFEAHEI
jgi:transcriptional/translational regulatory protein YebC/TACO1